MTGVARLHCLYLAGISVVRCQIVFTVVVYLLSVSVFQVLKLFSPGRVSVYLCPSWRLCTAGFTAPALPMRSAPPLCLESAPALPAHLTSTVFWSCLIKTICFSLAIGSRAFCTVTHVLIVYLFLSAFKTTDEKNTLIFLYIWVMDFYFEVYFTFQCFLFRV